MDNPKVSNPNDFKVVSFHNAEEFGFTPEMGCMYDGRGINGKNGSPGIDAGETVILPYHIGQQLALNLAKIAMTRRAPDVDPAGIPTGVPLWDEPKLKALKNTYLTDLYTEDRPVALSETDKLMAKVEEYKAMVDKLLPKTENTVAETSDTSISSPTTLTVFNDKQEVIAELEKRGIVHDKRKNKAELEKLLA